MIDTLLRQALEAHNRAISELSIAHAAEVARLKERIAELEADRHANFIAALNVATTSTAKPACKIEPDWSTAPEWAQWWAVDRDGEQWWHSSKPAIEDGHWNSGDCQRVRIFQPDWKSSLRQRPEQC